MFGFYLMHNWGQALVYTDPNNIMEAQAFNKHMKAFYGRCFFFFFFLSRSWLNIQDDITATVVLYILS